MIEISVVVPTYNRKAMLRELLGELAAQDYPKKRYEIIVVDDGSTDGTRDLVRSLKIPNLVYVWQKNAGPSTARDRGIKKAKGKIVALLDDDLLPSRRWLKAMASSFTGDVAAVEGRVICKGRIYPDSHFIRNHDGGMFLTCNMAFLKSVARFDNKYRYPNREDDDIAFEIIENGGRIIFSKDAVAKHRMLKHSLKSMLKRKLYFEADVLLFKKYPKHYKKKIRYPFEKFTTFYFLFSCLSFLNLAFLTMVLGTAIAEILYRKYSFTPVSFVKLLISQTFGSFLNIFAVLRGCIKYRVNPFRFLF